MIGTILALKKRDTYSEVHFIDCSVIWGEVMAGQRAYDSVLLVGVGMIDDGERLALALGADGREPRLQPCCLPINADGERGFPVMDGVEEVMGEVVRQNPEAWRLPNHD